MSTLARRPEMSDGVDPRDSHGPEAGPALQVLETFLPCVGEPFVVEGTPAALELAALELVEAQALPPQPGAPRERPFVLLFRGPAGAGIGQGMARLSHPRTGPVELFVVPVLGRGEGAFYEAVFN